jgi:hypothetical protein
MPIATRVHSAAMTAEKPTIESAATVQMPPCGKELAADFDDHREQETNQADAMRWM